MDLGTIAIAALVVVFLVIFGFVLLLAFTTGFHRSGRLMGGLFGLIGTPGAGKTFVATHYAIEEMKKGRRVFSNYPIVSVDGKYVSRVIEGLGSDNKIYESLQWLMKQNLNRAVLIIDEAHLFFWSRDFKQFSQDDKDFFTFLGQHEVSVYYIVQHEDRMDTIANDCANLFGLVTKFEIPILNMPLLFTVTWWASETDLKDSSRHPEIVPYHIDRIWFNLDTANSYDTRFFGHNKHPFYEGIDWITFKRDYCKDECGNGIQWEPPKKVSLSRFIRLKIAVLYDRFVYPFKVMVANISGPQCRDIRPVCVWLYWRIWCLLVFFVLPRFRKK